MRMLWTDCLSTRKHQKRIIYVSFRTAYSLQTRSQSTCTTSNVISDWIEHFNTYSNRHKAVIGENAQQVNHVSKRKLKYWQHEKMCWGDLQGRFSFLSTEVLKRNYERCPEDACRKTRNKERWEWLLAGLASHKTWRKSSQDARSVKRTDYQLWKQFPSGQTPTFRGASIVIGHTSGNKEFCWLLLTQERVESMYSRFWQKCFNCQKLVVRSRCIIRSTQLSSLWKRNRLCERWLQSKVHVSENSQNGITDPPPRTKWFSSKDN